MLCISWNVPVITVCVRCCSQWHKQVHNLASTEHVGCVAAASFPFLGGKIEQESQPAGEWRSAPSAWGALSSAEAPRALPFFPLHRPRATFTDKAARKRPLRRREPGVSKNLGRAEGGLREMGRGCGKKSHPFLLLLIFSHSLVASFLLRAFLEIENHLLEKAKNYDDYRRWINKTLLQVLGLYISPNYRYSSNCFAAIYRARYTNMAAGK